MIKLRKNSGISYTRVRELVKLRINNFGYDHSEFVLHSF